MSTEYSLDVSSAAGNFGNPFVSGASRSSLTRLRNFLNKLIGGHASSPCTVTVRSAPVKACGYIKLVSWATGQVIEVNGVPFTSTAAASVAGNDEVLNTGSDAADAGLLKDAINACTKTGVAGVVTALANADKLTPSTAIAGNTFVITLADGSVHKFTGAAAAATVGAQTFDTRTSNAACATSITAQVNGYAPFSGKILAIDETTKVVFDSLDGLGFTLVGTVTTLAEANDGRVQVTAVVPGRQGNSITLKTLGLVATTTATCATVVATDTLVINGQTLTGIVQNASGTLTPATAIAGSTFSIAGNVFTGVAGAATAGTATFSIDTGDAETCDSIIAQINAYAPLSGLVTASEAASDVVVVRAVTAGTAGNSIALAGTVTVLAASAATLEGGIAVANNQFAVEAGATDTQVATDIARCINASTTTLLNRYVRATSRAAVVHLWSKVPGLPGNGITSASTGGTITVAATRLGGATTLSYEGAQASALITLASWLNTETVVINGVTITAHTNTQANNQVDISGDDTADAVNLSRAINESTTAGLADVIATPSTNTVTVKSRRGGPGGNLITIVGTAVKAVVSLDASGRLAGGAVPTTVVLSAAVTAAASPDGRALTTSGATTLKNGAHTAISYSF